MAISCWYRAAAQSPRRSSARSAMRWRGCRQARKPEIRRGVRCKLQFANPSDSSDQCCCTFQSHWDRKRCMQKEAGSRERSTGYPRKVFRNISVPSVIMTACPEAVVAPGGPWSMASNPAAEHAKPTPAHGWTPVPNPSNRPRFGLVGE